MLTKYKYVYKYKFKHRSEYYTVRLSWYGCYYMKSFGGKSALKRAVEYRDELIKKIRKLYVSRTGKRIVPIDRFNKGERKYDLPVGICYAESTKKGRTYGYLRVTGGYNEKGKIVTKDIYIKTLGYEKALQKAIEVRQKIINEHISHNA